MTIGQSMLPEFDEEMKSTRKVLERAPDDKWGWKPHEKSGTVGWLAAHIGTVPGWITMTINTNELDYAPVDGPGYEPPKITRPTLHVSTRIASRLTPALAAFNRNTSRKKTKSM